MSVFGLTVLIAQIALCLAACRVDGYLGMATIIVTSGATMRTLVMAQHRAMTSEPLGQVRWLALLATSTVVMTVILGACALALITPLGVVSLVFELLDLREAERSGALGKVAQGVMIALILAAIMAGVVLAIVATLLVAARTWPVAPDWRTGCRPLLWFGLAAGLIAVVATGLNAGAEADQLDHRIDRVARWGREARQKQADKLRCVAHVERGPSRCPLCTNAKPAALRLEADQAGRAALGEETRTRELQALARDARLHPPVPLWAVPLAGLGLVAIAVRAVAGRSEWPDLT